MQSNYLTTLDYLPLFFLWVDCLFLFIYFWTKHDDFFFCWLFAFSSFFFGQFSFIFLTWHEWWLLFFFFGWLVVFFSLYDFFFLNKTTWENLYKLLFLFSYFSPQPNQKKKSLYFFIHPTKHAWEKIIFFPSSHHFSPLNQIET